jgi:hypothetical protein
MRDPYAVQAEHEDRVGAAGGAGRVIVLRGDRDDVADRRLEPPGGRADDMRVAGDRLDRVVVAMLVGHEQDVGGMRLDRGVVERDPRRHLGRERPERVDRDRVLGAGERVRGLAVPASDHDMRIRFLTVSHAGNITWTEDLWR